MELIDSRKNLPHPHLPKENKAETYFSQVFPYEANTVPGVFCLVFCGNQVLFTTEADIGHPDVDIPGGHIDPGETPNQALKREVFEETGITFETYALSAFQTYTIENPPEGYPYANPSHLLFYTAIVPTMEKGNEYALWLTLDEAREKVEWVSRHRALFETLYQEAKYLRGDFDRSYLDVYDETGTTILDTKTYDEVHRQGLWHKGVHVWILTDDDKFIIQKRGADIQTKPNMLESAAAGHINSGSTSIQTVIEECYEEIGVDIIESEIEYVGMIIDQFEEMDGVIKNNEFDDIYLIKKNVYPDDISIGKKEVSEVLFIDAKEYLIRGIKEDPALAYRPEEYKILYKYLYGENYIPHN